MLGRKSDFVSPECLLSGSRKLVIQMTEDKHRHHIPRLTSETKEKERLFNFSDRRKRKLGGSAFSGRAASSRQSGLAHCV